jgi:hypothetical protein
MSSSIKEANLNLALQTLQQDPELNLYRASKIFNVSRNTLQR